MNPTDFSPQDSGPLYAETFLCMRERPALWAEPLNTSSNFLFLAVLIYWSVKVYRSKERPRFLLLCLPILALGFFGGVLYHGYRSWDVWYYLDYVPILLLSQLVAFYFWWRAGSPVIGVFAMLTLETVFLAIKFFGSLSAETQGTLFYLPLALNILFPSFVCLKKNVFPSWRPLLLSALLIAFALGFRQMDLWASVYFARGTHFLWHIFGALSTFFLAQLLWDMDVKRRGKETRAPSS